MLSTKSGPRCFPIPHLNMDKLREKTGRDSQMSEKVIIGRTSKSAKILQPARKEDLREI